MTAGIIAGVGTAIRLMEAVGIYLPTLTTLTRFDAVDLPIQVAGGALASAAYALACYAELRAVPVAFLSGAIGSAIALGALLWQPVGPVIADGVAAVIVGLVGGLLARRALTPPLVVVVAGITRCCRVWPSTAVCTGCSASRRSAASRGWRARWASAARSPPASPSAVHRTHSAPPVVPPPRATAPTWEAARRTPIGRVESGAMPTAHPGGERRASATRDTIRTSCLPRPPPTSQTKTWSR